MPQGVSARSTAYRSHTFSVPPDRHRWCNRVRHISIYTYFSLPVQRMGICASLYVCPVFFTWKGFCWRTNGCFLLDTCVQRLPYWTRPINYSGGRTMGLWLFFSRFRFSLLARRNEYGRRSGRSWFIWQTKFWSGFFDLPTPPIRNLLVETTIDAPQKLSGHVKVSNYRSSFLWIQQVSLT
jgi:hypothetical protein